MAADEEKGDMTVRTPVLSVTYGAFSLRLEGFDDPFATMRDVAEYFRTVLAEDRGFGTRPVEPRAEALRRFAEDRAGRRVGAGTAGGQLHLRAVSARAADPDVLPQAAALFDEDEAARPAPEGQERHPVSPAPDPDLPATTGADADALSAALDEARADTLEADAAAGIDLFAEADPAQGAGRRPALRAGADDAAVERLISQADSALSGAEAQRRHATFVQLKAAVAATRAEADAGGARRVPGQTAAEIARYRDVLAQSVGPRPDAPAARRAPRPETDVKGENDADAEPQTSTRDAPEEVTIPAGKGAPLFLSAELRILGNGNGGQVTPRRIDPVALSMDALFDEGAPGAAPAGTGFQKFLERASPATLTEMLDAGAAYLTHAAGMEDFPRLQLMRLIDEHAGDHLREEVMRCLGILLREGKVRRSRRGQFQSGPHSAFAELARRFRDRD